MLFFFSYVTSFQKVLKSMPKRRVLAALELLVLSRSATWKVYLTQLNILCPYPEASPGILWGGKESRALLLFSLDWLGLLSDSGN